MIDTSNFSAHDLRKFIYENFRQTEDIKSPFSSVVSLGFKYGLPYNSDLVFDVRFLPNPNAVLELKSKTGQGPSVIDFM